MISIALKVKDKSIELLSVDENKILGRAIEVNIGKKYIESMTIDDLDIVLDILYYQQRFNLGISNKENYLLCCKGIYNIHTIADFMTDGFEVEQKHMDDLCELLGVDRVDIDNETEIFRIEYLIHGVSRLEE